MSSGMSHRCDMKPRVVSRCMHIHASTHRFTEQQFDALCLDEFEYDFDSVAFTDAVGGVLQLRCGELTLECELTDACTYMKPTHGQ